MIYLRSSAAPRWMECAASAHFPTVRPEVDTDPAREGTCAAWVAELVINGDATTAEDMLGETHANGWVVDEDMVTHVQWYIDTVMARPGTHMAECRLEHPHVPMGGTMDHIGWSEDGKTLYIDDLKYGYGVVEPTSWQLVAYALLVFVNTPVEKQPNLIQLSILQPRAMHRDGPYRSLVLSHDEIMERMRAMRERIEAIVTGDTTAMPGSHCYGCSKAIGCEANQHSVYEMWEPVQSRAYLHPTPAQLAEELVMLELMEGIFKARVTAVRAEAEALMNEGEYLPGWSVSARYGKRKFTVSADMVEMLTGVEATSKKLVTPAEMIRRGADETVVKSITTTPRIGSKLERFDKKTKET